MVYREQWSERLAFYLMDVEQQHEAFARDVAQGLAAPQKTLPAKYFYDERGSQLYEQICTLPEYYPYRAERDILATYAPEIYADYWSRAPGRVRVWECRQNALSPHGIRTRRSPVSVLSGGYFPHRPGRISPEVTGRIRPPLDLVPYTLTLLAILASFGPCAWRKKPWRFLAPISATLPAKKALTSCKVLRR